MSVISINTDEWPLVVQVFNGQQTDADVEQYMKDFEAVLSREEAFVAITEMREFASNLSHVRRFAEWSKAEGHRSTKYCLGNAFLTESTAFSFVLSSFFLLSAMPFPHKMAKNREQAIAWLRELTKDCELKLPNDL